MLKPDEAVEICQELLAMRRADSEPLELLRSYWLGEQDLPVVPTAVPSEVKRMAEMSRINVCSLVVNVPAQAMTVVGIRDESTPDVADAVWEAWQANKMDAHQAPVHRSVLGYGTSYVRVLPGRPYPVMRGRSPRQVTTAYGSDPDWPEYALECVDARGGRIFELYDRTHIYRFAEEKGEIGQSTVPKYLSEVEHGAPECPFVRYTNLEDLEHTPHSEITPVIPLQDQLDLTTFNMLVAQHYGAFRQRYVIGWLAESESQAMQAAASRMQSFEDPDVKVGEFGQTDLSGYLDSRKATIEHMGVVSQVPPHNLIGQMVNLSAEALVAAEVGSNRKKDDRETSVGESHEQSLWLTGKLMGLTLSRSAQVRWKETEARSLAQTVDALGKMVQMLGVPAEAAWERIPGVTQQDVDAWKALRANDAINDLFAGLDRQTAPVPAA
jgi:hypothetical protein